MSDLLKEAIADAKAVRETALQNAKMALEEAFTPQLKSMLSAKLKEEELEEEETPVVNEEEDDEEEVEESSEPVSEDTVEESDEPVEESEEPVEESEVSELSEEEDDEDEEDLEEGEHEDDEDEVDESALDLEAIIRELEDEVNEGEHEDDEDEAEEGRGIKEEDEEDEEAEEGRGDVDEEYEIDEAALEEDEEIEEEYDKSSGIGKSDNSVDKVSSSGIGSGKKGMKESSELAAELKEYKEAVKFLKGKLHEVNILNAKLLFTNKLFKEYALNNNQKLKVVETFDRAQTTREIKLVYSTLAEQFGDNGSIVTKKSISESASTSVASTKPSKETKKVISEEVQVANRFKKLAGLIK